ncbi:CIC11C00000001303 [Sungouiella intermedia]|uniref:CIC11C00000001303 n=1 Tax=Sungouiella intermedia TaxID=45354 RepID=A0A1L0DQL1_9ASCO|nr:CIC11C00000001303 [[Candida] intermedia]
MDHVAVLVLDTPIPGVTEHFGDFGDNAVDLLNSLSLPLKTYQIAYSVCDDRDDSEYKKVAQAVLDDVASMIVSGTVKGVVLTGSRSDSFATNVGWIDALDHFIKNTLFNSPRLPMVGFCFGHQILAKNMDCKVDRNVPEHGWETGLTTIELNKSILDIEKSPFRDVLTTDEGEFMKQINLIESHGDVVYHLPVTESSAHALLSETKFQCIGSTAKCSVQGLVTEEGPIKVLTFQGHPEFTSDLLLKLLQTNLEKGTLDHASFQKLVYNTQTLVNQGSVMAKAIIQFIETYI